MRETKQFSMSANGDRWALDTTDGETVVVHNGNEPSGGHQTRIPLAVFLEQSVGKPEHAALLQVLGQSREQVEQQLQPDEIETPSHRTAAKYLRLGGRRLAKVDDNIVSVRAWGDDPAEAEAFWQTQIEPLDLRKRQEVFLHLPSISDQ